jgi:hypothetical protein
MPKTSSGVSARALVRAIGDAAERWCDADFPPRVRASTAIERRLGYSLPVIDYALDRLFGGLTAAALEAAIAGELGSLDALDGFVERPGRPAAWARPAGDVTIVSSDTTIGVAIPAFAFALAAKCAVTVKDRSDDLVAAFAATLAEEHPALGDAAAVLTWSGGDDAREERLFGNAAVVVAFGADDALREIRARCAADATFVPFGRRASAGYVDAAALAGDPAALAGAIARDALLYDGDGCLSLHLLYVERVPDGAHERLLDELAAACARTAIEFPPGTRPPARAARAQAFADVAAFRAANGMGRSIRAADGAWCVVADPPPRQPLPFGAGTLPVVFVDGAGDAGNDVRERGIPLQALGVADPHAPSAVEVAKRLGVVRIARFGTLQDPPLAGHHGGRARIADFVRWLDRA